MRAPDHAAHGPLSDHELDQIASTAAVPEEHRPNMKSNIGLTVHLWATLGAPHKRSREDERQRHLLRQHFNRTTQAAGKFAKTLEEFINLSKRLGLQDPVEDGSALYRVKSAIDTAKWIVASKSEPDRTGVSVFAVWAGFMSRSRGRGRPPRSGKHQALYRLVGALHDLIEIQAKGRLSFWEDRHTGNVKGPLPSVLKILRPHLPH